jgi:hypothetical protein
MRVLTFDVPPQEVKNLFCTLFLVWKKIFAYCSREFFVNISRVRFLYLYFVSFLRKCVSYFRFFQANVFFCTLFLKSVFCIRGVYYIF